MGTSCWSFATPSERGNELLGFCDTLDWARVYDDFAKYPNETFVHFEGHIMKDFKYSPSDVRGEIDYGCSNSWENDQTGS
ncbi:hypothetical protein [Endozoicomonas sp. 8E]|uniref:hypothetical protein n=1 Tax=Endozoicomonas sp. 8E TaxID=3035692 RepID=UPI0029391C0F|nr:hypothetical protein [Endozoicomonas sp. 8E]WOG28907.1 hypothetical protein P6910_04380 [Endozoicomonas sp. 8E]